MKCGKCTQIEEATSSFTFKDLLNADPPKKKGVYVIRVSQRGKSFQETVEKLKEYIQWKLVVKYVFGRLDRLKSIDDNCNIIYIGSAGTYKNSNNTLLGRYNEFASRHTIQFPIWLLLAIGWELQFGWFETDSPKELEEKLKRIYKQDHQDKLPALVKR
jgi:hypothetical protein